MFSIQGLDCILPRRPAVAVVDYKRSTEASGHFRRREAIFLFPIAAALFISVSAPPEVVVVVIVHLPNRSLRHVSAKLAGA